MIRGCENDTGVVLNASTFFHIIKHPRNGGLEKAGLPGILESCLETVPEKAGLSGNPGKLFGDSAGKGWVAGKS